MLNERIGDDERRCPATLSGDVPSGCGTASPSAVSGLLGISLRRYDCVAPPSIWTSRASNVTRAGFWDSL